MSSREMSYVKPRDPRTIVLLGTLHVVPELQRTADGTPWLALSLDCTKGDEPRRVVVGGLDAVALLDTLRPGCVVLAEGVARWRRKGREWQESIAASHASVMRYCARQHGRRYAFTAAPPRTPPRDAA